MNRQKRSFSCLWTNSSITKSSIAPLRISYLKSAIYDIQQRLSETEPLSYQLTLIEQSIRKGKQPSLADLQKVDDQLKGIQARYLQALQTLKSAHTPLSYQDEKK
jgi:type VI secretion system protein VasL